MRSRASTSGHSATRREILCENGPTATGVVASREAQMGNKNKESKGTKRAAEKSLKEKRRAKKAKKAAQHPASTDSLDKTFGH